MFNRTRSILFAAAVVAIASCEVAISAVSAAYGAVRTLFSWAGEFAASLLFGPQEIHAGTDVRLHTRQKAQAREFAARIEKRERPTITSSWRMCPSC